MPSEGPRRRVLPAAIAEKKTDSNLRALTPDTASRTVVQTSWGESMEATIATYRVLPGIRGRSGEIILCAIDVLLCVCSWWAAIKAFATQDEVKQAVMSDPKHVHLLVFVAPGWCHWSQKQLQELQANFGVCRFACAVPCTQCRPYVHYIGTS